jgi:hypothetical protein
LSLVTDAAYQNVRLEVGPVTGEVRVYGFPGISDGTSFSGITSALVKTGGGNDQFALDALTFGDFAVAVDTGAGELSTSVQWKVGVSAAPVASTFDLVSIAGPNQFANVEFVNDAAKATFAARVVCATSSTTKVLSVDPTDTLGVSYFGSAVNTTLEVTSRAQALNVAARGSHTAIGNSVKYTINQNEPAPVNFATGLALGPGNDSLELLVNAPGSPLTLTGIVRARGGDDLLLVVPTAASTTSGLALGGEAGADQLTFDVKGAFQLSPTLRTRLLGGAGNDLLTLQTDSAIVGSGLPNDLVPLIDGGADFDLYKAFGEIVNCEGTF